MPGFISSIQIFYSKLKKVVNLCFPAISEFDSMKKISLSVLIIFFSVSVFSFAQTEDPTKWESEVKAYEKQDSLQPAPTNGIVFTGSSSIRLWKDISQKFPGKKIINRGIGGSELTDIIHYADRLIYQYKPKKVFIYCGGNDINDGKTPERILEDFKTLYFSIKSHLPNTKVYYISIQTAPIRVAKTEAFKRANELIKAYISSKTQDVFVDVFPLLLDNSGKPKQEFFGEDSLHMNKLGYERWARVLKPYVEQ
jgi:lysophospholipase L1-like esterase